jgi:8-oxo-dGTP pyrophosphatase MutT (NUDIX family)
MEHTDEPDYEKRARAGLIPYIRGEDGQLRYLMMIASDPRYGGPRPMISKGKIEDGETPLGCALREASEELGLRRDNLRSLSETPLADERVTLRSGAYHLTLFAAEVAERWNFDAWGDETSHIEWHTLAEFREHGRRDHVKFVELLERQLLGLDAP